MFDKGYLIEQIAQFRSFALSVYDLTSLVQAEDGCSIPMLRAFMWCACLCDCNVKCRMLPDADSLVYCAGPVMPSTHG